MEQVGVFVCGSPHTDVSALGWSLSQHSKFQCGPESRFLFKLFGNVEQNWPRLINETFESSAEPGTWLDINKVTLTEFWQYMGAGIDLLFTSRANGLSWIETSPENALIIDILTKLFPSSLFICLWQTEDDALNQYIGKEIAARENIIFTTRHFNSKLEAFADQFPAQVLLVEEAALINAPDETFERIFMFLEAYRESGVVNFYKSNPRR